MKKKILSVLLCLMLVITNGSLAFALETTNEDNNFYDMPDNWSTEALNRAVDNGLLKGYEKDGKAYIYAKKPLTRAELATVINRAFGSSVKADISEATDVAETKWYADEMAKAVMMGAFSIDTQMRPNDNITREEAFVALARVFNIDSRDEEYSALNSFSDNELISDWAKEELCGMVEEGYVKGSNGKLSPLATISRAELAVLMDNLVKEYISQPGTFTELSSDGNVLIQCQGVTLKNLTIKGDLIIGDGVGEGDLTLNGVTIEGKVIVRGGGVNSLHFTGLTIAQNLVLANPFGDVRLVIAGSAQVGNIVVDLGSQGVIVKGNFGFLNVLASGINLKIDSGMEDNTLVTGNNSPISFNETPPISRSHSDGTSSTDVTWASNNPLTNSAISATGIATSAEVTARLDEEVSINSTDGRQSTAIITWQAIPNYDGTSPGAYTATGDLTLPTDWVGTPSVVTATVNVGYADESDFAIFIGGTGVQLTGYTGTSSALAIPERISGSAVISIGTEVFHLKQFTNIRLPSSLREIFFKSFHESYNLQSITIPSSVTEIGTQAFENCTSLTSVIIQGEGPVGNKCFYNCPVTSISVSSAFITFGENLFTDNNDFKNAYTSGAAVGSGVPGTYTKSDTGIWTRQ